MSNPKLFVQSELHGGTALWRVHAPLVPLVERGWEVQLMDGSGDPELRPAPGDIWVFSGEVPLEDVAGTIEQIRSLGMRVAYDIDDAYGILDATNPKRWMAKQREPQIDELLEGCDLVTTTTRLLADYLRTRTDRPVAVLPNVVNAAQWHERPHGNHLARVGFVGSDTHLADLVEPLEALVKLQERYEFELVLNLGIVTFYTFDAWVRYMRENMPDWEKSDWGRAADEVDKLVRQIKSFRWDAGVSSLSYPRHLAELDLDVGVCPLRDTPFNRCKSPIKGYEYALAGTASIAQGIPPFLGEHSLLANSPQEWEDALKKLLRSPRDRRRVAAEQRRLVLENRQSRDWAGFREEIYAKLSSGKLELNTIYEREV